MTTSSDFSVRMGLRDGVLEISGPDKDWVDAKIDELSGALFGVYEPVSESRKPGQRKPAKRKAAGPAAEGDVAERPTPRRPRGTAGRSSINEDLRSLLTPAVKSELESYVAARRKAWDKSQPAQAAIIATFLLDNLGINGVDQHDLYTVYSAMGERTPSNIRSQLTNARQRARYFAGLQDGKMILSHAGENFGRLDSVGAGSDDEES